MKRLFLLIFILFSVGCNRFYVADHAYKDPAKGISIPHPVEYERAGVKKITICYSFMNPAYFVEMIGMGGVWPVMAETDDGNDFFGLQYLWTLDGWGRWVLRTEFATGLNELKNAKILSFNRDAGFVYDLTGAAVGIEDKTDNKCVVYDPKEFEKDKQYKREFFQKYGKTLRQVDEFMKKSNGIESSESNYFFVKEVTVGSTGWEEYKQDVVKAMPAEPYVMPDGSIHLGYLPVEAFRYLAVQNNGLTTGEKYIGMVNTPLLALPFTGVGFLVLTGTELARAAVVTGIDKNFSGYYARANGLRHELAPTFQAICAAYQALIAERNNQIIFLQREIENLKGGKR